MPKRRYWRLLLSALTLCAVVSAEEPGEIRIERIPVSGGAELIVLHRNLPVGKDEPSPRSIPMLAVLRDTLGDGDPDNDRLRYVWSLTYARPSWPQRLASTLPFFYWRVGHKPGRKAPAPTPILDLSKTQRLVWESVTGNIAQTLLFDSQGAFLRSSTRAFRGNAREHRQAHLMEAASLLERAGQSASLENTFSPRERDQLEARLDLTARTFGGLVSPQGLHEYVAHERTERQEMRGHNWELLRQRAEVERLQFQPLFDGPDGPRFALISVAREDLDHPPARAFQRKFLSIGDPWRDQRVLKQKGDTIPLAVYALDHPRTPLLLADFRNVSSPRRREMAGRAVTDVANGVVGVSLLGNWYYFAGRAGYEFVKGRHGAALDRLARVRAYEELGTSLTFDSSLAPSLSKDLRRLLNRTTINPLENDFHGDQAWAQGQYHSLLSQANDPRALPARLDKDRREEMTKLTHDKRAQAAFHVANLLSLGLYTHREEGSPQLTARLAQERRFALHRQVLRDALASSPSLDVTTDSTAIRRSVDIVSISQNPSDVELITRVFRGSSDPGTRTDCLRALARNGSPSAQLQLQQLARDPGLAPAWRDQTVGFLTGQAPVGGSSGAQ